MKTTANISIIIALVLLIWAIANAQWPLTLFFVFMWCMFAFGLFIVNSQRLYSYEDNTELKLKQDDTNRTDRKTKS
jgi:hypothetical protein